MAWTGLAVGQQPQPPAAVSGERILTIREPGQPEQKYKVLKSWKQKDGTTAYQVRSLTTGEILTLIDPASVVKSTAPAAPSPAKKGEPSTLPATPAPVAKLPDPVSPPRSTSAAPAQSTPSLVTKLLDPAPVVKTSPVDIKPAPAVKVPDRTPQVVTPDPRDKAHANQKAPTPTPVVKPKNSWPSAFVGQPEPLSSTPAPDSPTVVQPKPVVVYVPPKPVAPTPRTTTEVRPPAKSETVRTPTPAAPATDVQPPLKTDTVKTPAPVAPATDMQPPVKTETVKTPAPVMPTRDVSPPVKVEATNVSLPAAVKEGTPPASDWRGPWSEPAAPKTDTRPPVELPKPTPNVDPPKPAAKLEAPKPIAVAAPPRPNLPAPDPKDVPAKMTRADVVDSGLLARTAQAAETFTTPKAPTHSDSAKGELHPTMSFPVDAATAPRVGVPTLPVRAPKAATPPWVVDANEPNAFSPPAPEAGPQTPAVRPAGPHLQGAAPINWNAMPPAQQGTAYPPMPGQGLPYPVMPQMPMQGMDQRVSTGMANAFTTGGTARPIAGDSGAQPMVGNAFMNSRMPAYPPTTQSSMMAPLDPAVAQTMATLRESPYPSYREMAAEQLSFCDWRRQPAVLAALVASARSDPAATVRAGCVRVLVRIKAAETPEVMAMLRDLRNDKDERVRQEVAKALPPAAGTANATDATVHPVGVTQPAR
jgi:hypothetical protein